MNGKTDLENDYSEEQLGELIELRAQVKTPETEYETFKLFFEMVFKKPRKCKLTDDVVDIGDKETPLLSLIEYLQSKAMEYGLPKSNVTPHLYRYIKEMASTLLIDIPRWDGRDRIKEICSFIKLKDGSSEMLEEYLKAWGAGIFRKYNDSEYQNTFIILKGDQGIGKDRLVTYLCGALGRYYNHFQVDVRNDADLYYQVHSSLVLHIEEFDQTEKLSTATLKEMATVQHKTFRMPFQRVPMRRKMNASFISTANVEDIFRDTTGNRRFAVFDVEAIDWDYPKDSSAQILAQFKALYEASYTVPEASAIKMREKIIKLTPDDPEKEIIHTWDIRAKAIALGCGTQPAKDLPLRHNDVMHIIKDLAFASGLGVNKIKAILKRHGRKGEDMISTAYYFR